MKELVDKLVQIKNELIAERGPLNLFGLFLREGAPDRWDLVIAAPWAQVDDRSAYELVVNKLKKILPLQELLMISRVAFPDPMGSLMQEITASVGEVRSGMRELHDSTFNGMAFRHAYVLASEQPLTTPTAP